MPKVESPVTGIEGSLGFGDGLEYVADSFETPHININDMYFNPTDGIISFNSSNLQSYDLGEDKVVCSAKFKVTVKDNPIIKYGKKALSSAVYKVKKGKTLTFKIYRKVASINNAYSSSKKAVVKVTSKTNATKITVKGYKVGSATVSVKINGVKTYKIKVKVVK